MEEQEIVARFLGRDTSALRVAQERYGPMLLRLAERIVYDPRDAEECVNDALLRAWNAIPPHKPVSLGAFLSVIVRQSALDLRRRQTALKRGGTSYELCLDELEECVSGSPEFASAEELTEAIERYLNTLSAEMRTAFLRRYFAAQSVREIAAALRCTESKVKSMLLRARRGLRSHLEQEGFPL